MFEESDDERSIIYFEGASASESGSPVKGTGLTGNPISDNDDEGHDANRARRLEYVDTNFDDESESVANSDTPDGGGGRISDGYANSEFDLDNHLL